MAILSASARATATFFASVSLIALALAGPALAQSAPNTGEAELNSPTEPISVWTDCARQVFILHRIVTHDTPRARDLYGKLKITRKSGDPTIIEIEQVSLTWISFFGASIPMTLSLPYALGSPIPVIEPGHVGPGVHTWHQGIEAFRFRGRKPGQVVLEAEVDPDPEVPEGAGSPTKTATFTVNVPIATKVKVAEPTSWNDLDWKNVIFRGDSLKIKIGVSPPLHDFGDIPCKIKISTTGTRVAAEGTHPTPVDIALGPANTAVANNGAEVRVTLLPADLIGLGLIGPTPADTVPEYTTADYVAPNPPNTPANPPASNQNDSNGFDADFQAVNRQRGKARTTWNGTDGNINATPPESSVNMDFMKAAGVEIVEVELDKVKSEKRQIQNQADILYYSGHGQHVTGGVKIAGGWFGPGDATGQWNQDLKKVFFAGCAVLDIKDYNNNFVGGKYTAADHAASPGEKWIATGPQMFFGYNFIAPLDNQAGNANLTRDIVANYVANRTAGFNENWSWGKANKDLAAGASHTTGPGRPMTCAFVDLTTSPPEYWYFVPGTFTYTWTRKTPPW